jgi:hypothetical protein
MTYEGGKRMARQKNTNAGDAKNWGMGSKYYIVAAVRI